MNKSIIKQKKAKKQLHSRGGNPVKIADKT